MHFSTNAELVIFSLFIINIPFVIGTAAVCSGQDQAESPLGFANAWDATRWGWIWEARDYLCTNNYQTSGSYSSPNNGVYPAGVIAAQTNVGPECAQDSCWNNFEEIIYSCLNTQGGAFSSAGQVNDYGGECWYWLWTDGQLNVVDPDAPDNCCY
jgi:hypothetical protein